MAREIELPDGSIGEFPDDMEDDAIASVLQKQFPAPAQPPADPLKVQMAAQSAASPVTAFNTGIANASTRLAAGIGSVLPNALAKYLPSQRDVDLLEAGSEGNPYARTGQVAMDIAATAPLAAGKLIPAAARMAGYGAASADEGDRTTGALVGAGGQAAGHVLGRAIQGLNRPVSAEASLLREQKVPLTAGQLYGGGLDTLERTAAKVPYAGAPLRKRLDESMLGFQQATRSAAAPGAKTLDEMNKHFDEAYTAALKQAEFKEGARFILDPETLLKQSSNGQLQVPKATADRAIQVIGDVVGTINSPNPQQFHWAEKRLKAIAFNYKSSPDPAQREFGDLIYDAAKTLKSDWRSKLKGDTGKLLGEVDTAYQSFVPVRHAASKGVATLENPEQYTPRMLLQALRHGDKTPTKSAYMGGTMPQQPLAAAGEKVIGSGSVNPNITSNILSAGVIPAAVLTGSGPLGMASAAGLWGYGTKPVQKLLTSKPAEKLVTGQYGLQQAIAAALRRSAPAVSLQGSRNDE